MIYNIRLIILFVVVLCGAYVEHRASEQLSKGHFPLKPVLLTPGDNLKATLRKQSTASINENIRTDNATFAGVIAFRWKADSKNQNICE